ncbi:hypothetical protein ABEB36_007336 [Hypothenemus hampei]|uniref:Uncharacterized protein n=1 Tax=Hypothenemus hampei TaxID=57062 RepID=A0ABD1ETU3_HYPHA
MDMIVIINMCCHTLQPSEEEESGQLSTRTRNLGLGLELQFQNLHENEDNIEHYSVDEGDLEDFIEVEELEQNEARVIQKSDYNITGLMFI